MTGKNIMTSVCLAAIMAVALLCAAGEESSGPGDPVEPSADLGGKEGNRQSWVRVSLVRARGERLEGELSISFASLDLEVIENNNIKKKSVPLADITAIEFVRWQGQKRRKNEYAFFPSLVRVTLTDTTVMEGRGPVRALNRLRLRTGDRTRSLYSYFFDYRDKDAWRNSGRKEMNYPETNPHGDTVAKINFIRKPEANPLDLFIESMKRK